MKSNIKKNLSYDKLAVLALSVPITVLYPVVLAPLLFEVVINATNMISSSKGNAVANTAIGKLRVVSLLVLLATLYATMVVVINPNVVLGLFTINVALESFTAAQYILIHSTKEKVKKSVNAIRVNVESNPMVEEIKSRGRCKKVKMIELGSKSVLDKDLDLKPTIIDLEQLRDKVIPIEEFEKAKELTIGVDPKMKKSA